MSKISDLLNTNSKDSTRNNDLMPQSVPYYVHSSPEEDSIIVHIYIDIPKDGYFYSILGELKTNDFDYSNILKS